MVQTACRHMDLRWGPRHTSIAATVLLVHSFLNRASNTCCLMSGPTQPRGHEP